MGVPCVSEEPPTPSVVGLWEGWLRIVVFLAWWALPLAEGAGRVQYPALGPRLVRAVVLFCGRRGGFGCSVPEALARELSVVVEA